MGVPLKVLLVEDYEDDALLLLRELKRGGYDPVYERVDTAGAMEHALDERDWDLVIADHSMPAFSSSAALELLRKKGFANLPFIIVSGQIGEQVAVEAMKAGAQDYLMKDNLARLNTAIERELREAEGRRERIAERKQAEWALREIREAERRRIARELHDVVLQDLAGALQGMQAAQIESGDLGPGLEQEIAALRRAVGSLRNAIYNLRLEKDQPFVRAVESLVELNRQLTPEREIRLTVRDGFPPELPGSTDVELLRVLQEALVNARRHSDARCVDVVLCVGHGEVRVEVADNGLGFEPAPARRGVGISGMRERATALGGRLEVESAPGEGTSVRVKVPFSGSR